MHRNPAVWVFLAVSMLFCAVSIATAQTWVMSTDFSVAGNPWGSENVWSAGIKMLDGEGIPRGDFHLFRERADHGWNLWHGGYLYDEQGNYLGVGEAWKNLSGGWQYGIPPGWISINSDVDCTSTMRWTAPRDGRLDLAAWVGGGDWGRGYRRIFHNQDTLWDGGWGGTIYGGEFTGIDVSYGDTIDFTVWGGGAGGNTPIDAVFRLAPYAPPVPEPATLALLLSGGAMALGGRLLRRRR